jgi:hypothetical protein
MTSPSQTKPKTWVTLLGLGAFLFFLFFLAVSIGASLLGNPYCAIALFALFCCLIAYQLRCCFLAAKGTVYATTLTTVTLFFVLAILAGAKRLGDVFTSENHDYVRAASDPMIYIALVTALGLIETLLKNAGVKANDRASAESLSAEVKALADTADGKIAAIALHRDQTGAGLAEAKDAVEKYIAARGVRIYS